MSTSTQTSAARGRIVIVDDPDALAEAAATAFEVATNEAVRARGRAFVALSGGSTPKRMGALLAGDRFREEIPWDRLELFWGDERWVPLADPESNAGAARRGWIDRVPVPTASVHPWPTEEGEPDAAAAAYAETLRRCFGVDGGLPRFDLVLLGMGDDGHTASLFPRTRALAERERLAVDNFVPKLGASRLTLTVPVLNAGREVVFLAAGDGKAETLRDVLEGPARPDDLPSQLISPTAGPPVWLVDRAAARLLRRE